MSEPPLKAKGFKGSISATSWCDQDLTFDLVVVTLAYKIGRDIGPGM